MAETRTVVRHVDLDGRRRWIFICRQQSDIEGRCTSVDLQQNKLSEKQNFINELYLNYFHELKYSTTFRNKINGVKI